MKKNSHFFFFSLVTFVCFVLFPSSCKKEEVLNYADLTTTQTDNIKSISAVSSGNIIRDGGSKIIESGICWSLSPNPTVSDFKALSSIAMGTFTCSLSDLIPDTTYYIRAFALNNAGYAYGSIKSFNTLPVAELTTTIPFSLTANTAISGGNIITDYGTEITQRGVCWSTSINPKMKDFFTLSGNGIGEFTSNLSGLKASTKYYLRAFAMNQGGIIYGNTISFTTPEAQ